MDVALKLLKQIKKFPESQVVHKEMGCGRHVPSLASWVRSGLHMTGLQLLTNFVHFHCFFL